MTISFPNLLERLAKESEEELSNTFNVSEAVLTQMKNTTVSDVNGKREISIDSTIKDAIINSDGGSGSEDTVKNIRKKRSNFLNILFNENKDDETIITNSENIGLDRTFSGTNGAFPNKSVLTNVALVKNGDESADVSSLISSDTGIYCEVDQLGDEVALNVGGDYNVVIIKIVDASDNGDVDKWKISYGEDSITKEAGEKITVNGYTIYIGSSYLDGSNEGIPSGIYDLTNLRIPFVGSSGNTYKSDENIIEDRHTKLNSIWSDNLGSKIF